MQCRCARCRHPCSMLAHLCRHGRARHIASHLEMQTQSLISDSKAERPERSDSDNLAAVWTSYALLGRQAAVHHSGVGQAAKPLQAALRHWLLWFTVALQHVRKRCSFFLWPITHDVQRQPSVLLRFSHAPTMRPSKPVRLSSEASPMSTGSVAASPSSCIPQYRNTDAVSSEPIGSFLNRKCAAL